MRHARPWLVVTDDGRRPWHLRFRVRHLPDGRRIAYWWGRYEGREPYTGRLSALHGKLVDRIAWWDGSPETLDEAMPALRRRAQRLDYIRSLLAGGNWELRHGSTENTGKHPGDCDQEGWIGIAYLPAEPDCWRPDAVWPRWRHLCHVYRGEDAMNAIWASLEDTSDEELERLLNQ